MFSRAYLAKKPLVSKFTSVPETQIMDRVQPITRDNRCQDLQGDLDGWLWGPVFCCPRPSHCGPDEVILNQKYLSEEKETT